MFLFSLMLDSLFVTYSTEVTGCISLESSVGGPESLLSSPVESEERNSSSRRTNFSANESSLGILDLDAMQCEMNTHKSVLKELSNVVMNTYI